MFERNVIKFVKAAYLYKLKTDLSVVLSQNKSQFLKNIQNNKLCIYLGNKLSLCHFGRMKIGGSNV